MELPPFRLRGLLKLTPLLIACCSTMLLLSIYYLPTAEKAVSYFGFRHGSSWDLAHGADPMSPAPAMSTSTSKPVDDSTLIASHLSTVSASAKAARPLATGNVNIPPTGPTCQLVPGADSILVIMKLSALTISDKLPAQLSTVLSCIPNVLLVSNVAQDFHGHEVHDVLAEVDQRFTETEAEFEWSRTVQKYRTSELGVDVLGAEKSERMVGRLNRWMDVPALRLAGKKWPDVGFYVLVNVDTYLSFPGLLEVVREMDPEVPLYTGEEGSGYLVSRAAGRMFEEEFEKGGKERWEEATVTANREGGMLELAMKESGVELHSLPHGNILQDNALESFSAWDSTWCRLAVSWQHITSAEVEQMWKWERRFIEMTGHAVILFKNVFEGMIEPRIREGHEAGWQNYAASKILLPLRDNSTEEERSSWEGLEALDVDPTTTWDACERACQLDRGCLSWQFGPGRCNLGSSVILGKKTEGEVKEHGLAISGWDMKGIKRWKERLGHCA
jgi:hypothetical protein